ncbi:hypothetical protein NIES267_02470 [Calothrix parasitica NIES-267]|uniref:Uncharacterized protein n=1 Tax=Calothrix parasitica NIES-267 TaxID=1973488 RepID=A0A1Z4LHS1_9CYAN|nr:hypothetical protein NIES267_02470 [Calothrix parasitica NIES-267]
MLNPKGDGTWFGTFEENSGANTYSISTSLTELTEDISEVWSWNKGYDLVDVEYGDGTWFGVFQDVPGHGGYNTASSIDEFKQDISARWKEGYDLVDVEYGEALRCGGSLRYSKC